jgi:leucyl-tRNA synthetase
MESNSVTKAIEGLTVSKTKELKGVWQSSSPSFASFTETNLPQTEKRDALMAIETKYQRKWEEDKIFQTNAPSTSEVPLHSISAAELRAKYPKFFGCIAYP